MNYDALPDWACAGNNMSCQVLRDRIEQLRAERDEARAQCKAWESMVDIVSPRVITCRCDYLALLRLVCFMF